MNQISRRCALITGASAGIGKAFAELFAAEGYDLVLTARRRQRLEDLARACRERHGVEARVVVADLADAKAPQAIFDELAEAGVAIDALVNNAGYGVPNAYMSTTWQQQADFIQVLV
ncbi:MAG: SDR family NAD(P)-dependent oxidoreductase, partial [Alphaproteobacteria bacterium]|nr:SDR family NAD(P)-dependent oxidoreductase [Alphaproteobacteria bacterium]